MNGKSQTKQVLTLSKTKIQIDKVYKKHKSQESYTDLKTISTQIPLKSSKSKQNLSPKNTLKNSLNTNSNKITNVKIKNVLNMININSAMNTNTVTNFSGLNVNNSGNSPLANIVSFNNIFNTGECSGSNNNNNSDCTINVNAFGNNNRNNNSNNNSCLNNLGNSKSEKKIFINNIKNNLQNILNSNNSNYINNSNNKNNSNCKDNNTMNRKINLNNIANSNNNNNNSLNNLLLKSNNKPTPTLEKNSEKNLIESSNSMNNFNNNKTYNLKPNIIYYNSAAAEQKINVDLTKQTLFSQESAKIIDTEENEEDFHFDSQTPEKYENLSKNAKTDNIPKQNLNETFKGIVGFNSKSTIGQNNSHYTFNHRDNSEKNETTNHASKQKLISNSSKITNYNNNNNINNNNRITNVESETEMSKISLTSKSPSLSYQNFALKSNRKYEYSGHNSIVDEYDEMRSNCQLKDFYTNSIGEASCSLIDKGEGIINNIPNTFVRQSENKLIIQKNSKPYLELSNYNKDDGSTSNFNAMDHQPRSGSTLNNFNTEIYIINNNNKNDAYDSNNKYCGSDVVSNNASNNCFANIGSIGIDEVTNVNNHKILDKFKSNNNYLNKSGSENLNNHSKLKSEKSLDKVKNFDVCLQTQPSNNNFNTNKNQTAVKDNRITTCNNNTKGNSEKKANLDFNRFSNKNENKNLYKNLIKIKNNNCYNNNNNIGNAKHLATSISNNIFNTNFDFKKYMLDSKARNSNQKGNLNYQSTSNLNLNLNNNSINHCENFRNEIFYTHENDNSPANRIINNGNSKVISNTAKTKLLTIKNIHHNNPNNVICSTNAARIISNTNNSKNQTSCNTNKIDINTKNKNNIITSSNINNNINKSKYESNRESTNLFTSDNLIPAEKDLAYPTQFSSLETVAAASYDAKPILQQQKQHTNSNSNNRNNNNYNNQNLSAASTSQVASNSTSTALIGIGGKEDNTLILKLYTKLLVCAKKGDREAFLETLSHIYKREGNKTNISFKNESGWSALHYAAAEGNFKIIEILMKMNVDSNLRTSAKKSALHLSAEKGYFDVSRMLIENGALLSLLDEEKNSPIHLCAQQGHFELLKYFLEKFPQADTKNIHGKTPLDLAANEKIRELIWEFLNKKSYNFHKITIHTANSKIVNEFLSNIKDKKMQTHNPENLSNKTNNDFIQNYNQKNSNNNYETTVENKSMSNTNRGISNKNVINLNENEIKKNYQSEKYGNVNLNNNDNIMNFFEGKSSGSGSSLKTSLGNENNSSLDNLKFKRIRTAENNNSEEHSASSNLEHFISYEEEKIGPSAFICHALLGKGSFGEVYLVEKRDTKIFYAMKVLSKDKIMGIL